MRLSAYLDARDETQAAFAKRAGLTDSTLSRVMSGAIAPSETVIEAIRTATAGEVTANDLFDARREARRAAAQQEAGA